MPALSIVPRGCGFVLTELGRSAAASVDTCKCAYTWDGGTLVCVYCGTVFSSAGRDRKYIRQAEWKRD